MTGELEPAVVEMLGRAQREVLDATNRRDRAILTAINNGGGAREVGRAVGVDDACDLAALLDRLKMEKP